MFINDTFVTGGPTGKPELWRPTKLGNGVSVGTNATILPVTICDQVVIGAGAVVTKEISLSPAFTPAIRPGYCVGFSVVALDGPSPASVKINRSEHIRSLAEETLSRPLH
jgi:succinyltransferase-like protein